MHLTCASVASFVALTLTLASAGTPTAWAQKGPATTPQEGKRLVPDMAPSAKAEAQAQALQAQKRAAKYSFEFSKAEIQDVVKAISDLTGHNFIIPERIKGQRLTILSPTKVTAAEAYQIFFTALSANGISLVRVGKFYKLLDSKDAIKDVVPTCVGQENQGECAMAREQMVTALLRMRYIDASQVNTVARALLSKDGDITVFQPSNALIISEYAPNLGRVRKIIEALDVSGLDDALQIVQIQYASAAEVAEKLTQIFDVGGPSSRGGMGGRRSPTGSSSRDDESDVQISKIVPDDRTNQILIKANRRSFDAIKHLIHKIDVPISESEHGRVHVYYLENAKAEDLASTLSSLAQGAPAKKAQPTVVPGPVGMPPGAQGARGPENTTLFEGDVKITADKATNSLLVMCSAHDYRSMRALIEKLDVSRRQVYVEAAILEVNLKDDTQLGFDYHAPAKFNQGDLGPIPAANAFGFLQSAQSGSGGPSPTLTALTDSQHLLQAAGGALGGLIGGPMPIKVGVNNEQVQLPTFGVLLKWLTSTSNANVLSTPHILTTDNEQAQIEVGEKIPFNTGLFGGGSALGALASGGAGSNVAGLGGLGGLGLASLSGSVQRIDVSLKLKLTPQINERNKIRLEIDQTVEDVTGKDERTQTPTTSKRAIKTVVVVDDQQTIVLGGLIKDSTTESDTKIPLLGDLPLLGFFFKQHSTKLTKTNLLLILTPYIISSADDFQRIFERKMREHEEFAAEYYGHRKEFRAHVDYRKKTGPFGRMVNTLRREREKLENGGIGDGTESLIGPSKEQGRSNGDPGSDGDVTQDPEAGADVPAPNSNLDILAPEDTTAAPHVLGEDTGAPELPPPGGAGQEAP